MIEIAPVCKDKLTFDEAWLYVLLLDYNNKKDWRLPEFLEYMHEYDSNKTGFPWFSDSSRSNIHGITRRTLPVRTKDV